MDNTTRNLTKGLLILLIIGTVYLLRDLFQPIFSLVFFFITPLIMIIFIYYGLLPIKEFLAKYIKNNKVVSIIVYLLFISLIIFTVTMLVSVVKEEASQFIKTIDIKRIVEKNQVWLKPLEDRIDLDLYWEKISSVFNDFIKSIPENRFSYIESISTITGRLTSMVTQFFLVFIGLFYMIKDEDKLKRGILKGLKGKNKKKWQDFFTKLDKILRTYVSGQLLISTILGILSFIGYSIIGLDNKLLLALIALVTNLIPYIGPIIGTIPALALGLTGGPRLLIKIIIVAVIIQQLEGNIVSPLIMGEKLEIHPFMVMVAVLIFMNLFGIIGALIATPLYMILKELALIIMDIRKEKA